MYGLLLPVQRGKGALRAFLHHVVKPVCNAVLQTLDKGVLLCESGQDLLCVRVTGDEARHLHGNLIGKTHDRQKLPPLFRKRVDHGRRKGRIDVRMTAWQHTMLGKCAQIQVNSGKPALAGIEDLVDLRVGQLRAAPVGVDGQLRVVEPQLLPANTVQTVPQPEDLFLGQEVVPACHDQMDVPRQAVGQRAEKTADAIVCQQVEIVQEEVAGGLPRQLVAEVIHQQPAAGCVRGAGVIPQKVKAGAGKGALHSPPEDGQVVRVYADTDDRQRLGLCALLQIPVHRRGLSVPHGGHHSGEGTAGDGPQALLQPLGYVDRIQIPLRLWHGAFLRLCCRAASFSLSWETPDFPRLSSVREDCPPQSIHSHHIRISREIQAQATLQKQEEELKTQPPLPVNAIGIGVLQRSISHFARFIAPAAPPGWCRGASRRRR